MNARRFGGLVFLVALAPFLLGSLCGTSPGNLLRNPNQSSGPPPAPYDAGASCRQLFAAIGSPTDCKNAPNTSGMMDQSGQCLRDGYVTMAALYCWYAMCNATSNPEGAYDAQHCALNLECNALDVCGGTTFNPSEPCKSTKAFSCTSPPADLDCSKRDTVCSLSDPRGRGTCKLKGPDSPCTSNAQCCSGVCTTQNNIAGDMYHACCPWVYGGCGSAADCCPGMKCMRGSCVQPGGGVCIQNDQCASGHCGSRPGAAGLYGFCDCEGGGSTCCFPSGRPCQDDEECCSQLCDNAICK